MAEEQENFLIKEDEYNESKYNVSLDAEDIISAVEDPKVPDTQTRDAAEDSLKIYWSQIGKIKL